MELGIVAFLSYVGLMRNRVPRGDRYMDSYPDSECISNPFPHAQSNLNELAQKEAARQGAYYMQSRDPRSTAVIPPNMTPDQWPDALESNIGATDFDKQYRLEMFTGEQTAESQAITGSVKQCKSAQSPLFPPNTNAQPVNSAGKTTTVQSLEDELARQPVSQYHRNVRPFQQIQVGPGLGLGSEVQAAGGYQQGYRILPTNRMNFERLNREQKGGFVPGQAPVLQYGKPGVTEHRRPPKSCDMSNYTLEGNRANYTAAPPRPQFEGRCVNKPSEEYCPNPAGANGQYVQGTAGIPTRHKDDGSRILPILNPVSQFEGGGAYLNKPIHRPVTSTREQPSQLPAAYVGGYGMKQQYCEPKTNRQEYQQNNPVFASNPHVGAPAPRNNFQHVPTNREETQNNMYLGPGTGPAAFAPQAGAVRINNNKESQLHGYTPGMQSKNAYNPDVQAVRLKDQEQHVRKPVNETTQFMQYSQPGETTACKPRLPQENIFHDPVVQAVQRKHLKDNPLWVPFPI